MFSGCTSLETIDLSNADLGNVNNPFNNIEYRASAVFGNDNSSVCEGEGESKICGLDAYPYCANLSEIIVKNDNAKIWLDAKLNTSGNDEISNKYTLCYYKEHTLNNPCLVDMVKINSNTSQ